jgi:hypothetical protein
MLAVNSRMMALRAAAPLVSGQGGDGIDEAVRRMGRLSGCTSASSDGAWLTTCSSIGEEMQPVGGQIEEMAVGLMRGSAQLHDGGARDGVELAGAAEANIKSRWHVERDD